jgi:hypothetical protein
MRGFTLAVPFMALAACTGGSLTTSGTMRSPGLPGANPATAGLDGGKVADPEAAPSVDGGADEDPGGATDGGVAVADAGSPSPPPASIFPPDNPWNTRIDNQPVDPNSDAYIADMGADDPLIAAWDRTGDGLPYVEVGPTQTPVALAFWGYPKESDPGPYPIPWNAPVDPSSDRHVIVVDRQNGFLYELFRGVRQDDGSWAASNGAKWDLRSNGLRPLRWSSADAAGLPIFPGLVRWNEMESGWIGHALRFVVGHSQQGFVWPARHAAGTCDAGSNCPPMGLRVRLKASVDISGYSWRMRVILTALKRYGMFVADNGGGTSWWLSGAPDPRFLDSDLLSLQGIHGRDFEVVAHGPITPQ